MSARDVIAQALALSEKATEGPWFILGPVGTSSGEHWDVLAPDGVLAQYIGDEPDAAFVEAARTLLPALAKALGDVLAVCEQAKRREDRYRNILHTFEVYQAIEKSLSEVS